MTYVGAVHNVGIQGWRGPLKIELLTSHAPKSVTIHYLETQTCAKAALPKSRRLEQWIVEQAAIASGANVVVRLAIGVTKK